MSRTDDTRAWLVLARAPGIGCQRLASALAHCGSAQNILTQPSARLGALGFGPQAIAWLRAPDEALLGADQAWLDADGHHLITLHSREYPPLLREIADPPAMLFVSGDPALLAAPQLAMVGSRNPTAGGRETAAAFARHLAGCGLVITSGLARGIDAASHEGALAAGGATIAVLGTGANRIYPAANTALGRHIETAGALISELPPGTPPRSEHFPRRNRIISGLALGTLVVEAAERSGSLITARLAGEQGREVFAIPGSIHSPLARGCHRLIREGAKLVESARHVLEELGALAGAAAEQPSPAASAEDPAGDLDPDYVRLLDALGFEPASMDLLIARTGLTTAAVSSMLLILELRGLVGTLPGGRYERIPSH